MRNKLQKILGITSLSLLLVACGGNNEATHIDDKVGLPNEIKEDMKVDSSKEIPISVKEDYNQEGVLTVTKETPKGKIVQKLTPDNRVITITYDLDGNELSKHIDLIDSEAMIEEYKDILVRRDRAYEKQKAQIEQRGKNYSSVKQSFQERTSDPLKISKEVQAYQKENNIELTTDSFSKYQEHHDAYIENETLVKGFIKDVLKPERKVYMKRSYNPKDGAFRLSLSYRNEEATKMDDGRYTFDPNTTISIDAYDDGRVSAHVNAEYLTEDGTPRDYDNMGPNGFSRVYRTEKEIDSFFDFAFKEKEKFLESNPSKDEGAGGYYDDRPIEVEVQNLNFDLQSTNSQMRIVEKSKTIDDLVGGMAEKKPKTSTRINIVEGGGPETVVKTVVTTTELDYDVIDKYAEMYPDNEKRVFIEGETGVREDTYEIVEINGKEASKVLVSSEIIKDPVNEVVETLIKVGKESIYYEPIFDSSEEYIVDYDTIIDESDVEYIWMS